MKKYFDIHLSGGNQYRIQIRPDKININSWAAEFILEIADSFLGFNLYIINGRPGATQPLKIDVLHECVNILKYIEKIAELSAKVIVLGAASVGGVGLPLLISRAACSIVSILYQFITDQNDYWGIYLENSDDNSITENIIKNNGENVIFLDEDSENNYLWGNIIK